MQSESGNGLAIDSVAVIGAGPCGLAAAKYLLAEGKFGRVRVFEQRDAVGGIWTHNSLSAVDDALKVPRIKPSQVPETAIRIESSRTAQFVSPVYDQLETNIPHSLMRFSDQPFPQGTSLFPPHAVVKKYLEDYASELAPVLSLSTQVLDIRRAQTRKEAGLGKCWEVELLDLETGSSRIEEFDAVLVASGHYSDAYIPDIPGLTEFTKAYPRAVTHSKFYKNPSVYKDKKVLVVGNSASGVDLSAQIATVSKGPVLVSEKAGPDAAAAAAAVSTGTRLVPEMAELRVQDRSVRFVDGSVETDVDAVVFCTGYMYSYPFLGAVMPASRLDGACVRGLYEHVLYVDDPTLAFVGIPQRVVPFPLGEAQAAWVARIWAGRLAVPATDMMRAWEARRLAELLEGKNGDAAKALHDLHSLGFPQDAAYINRLHGWSMAARPASGLQNDGAGKQPPYWDEQTAWVRERFPQIKAASRALGERKHEVKTVAELGFEYPGGGELTAKLWWTAVRKRESPPPA